MREILNQLRWSLPLWLVGLLSNWWPDNRWSLRVRGAMARPFIRRCGRNFQLGAHVTLLNSWNLDVGDDVYIARGAWLNALASMTLESEVILSPYVVISTTQHVFGGGSVRFGGSIGAPVRVGRGSWLASHSTVKCGTAIGRGCLVAANSAVTKDVPDGTVVGGVPAKHIGVNADGEPQFHHRSQMLGRTAREPD